MERNILLGEMFPSSTPKITMATGALQAATELTALVKIPGRVMGKKYSSSPTAKAITRGFFKTPNGLAA